METLEIWKDVVGYEDEYQVSTHGRVRSKDKIVRPTAPYLSKGKIRKQHICPVGYPALNLKKNGTHKTYRVHTLMHKTFFNGEGECINHKDGIKTNNKIENLEPVTNKENIHHAYKTGLIKKKFSREHYDVMYSLYQQGFTLQHISMIFCMCPSYVGRVVKTLEKYLNE